MYRIITLIFAFLTSLPLFAGSHGTDKPFNVGEVIEHHLIDHPVFPLAIGGSKVFEGDPKFNPSHEAIFLDHTTGKKFHYVDAFEMHITKRVLMMWIVSFFLLITFIPIARKISSNPYRVQSRGAGAVEAFLEFLRDDVIEANMHGHGHGYYGYLFSLFFFILFCNLFGLIPPVGEIIGLFSSSEHSILGEIWSGITVTGDVSVTAALAGITLILIYATGFIYQGPLFPIYSVPNGVPVVLYILLFPLEFIISPIAKSFALAIRLLANMTAGHVIILSLLGFIFQFQSYLVAPLSIFGSVAIYLLEIFVAFLQAYVFTLLTSLFVGSSMHRH